MGLFDFVGDVIGKVTEPILGPSGLGAPAHLQAQTNQAAISTNKEVALKQLDFQKEQFEWAKTQAQGPLGQTGSYGYPYVSVTQVKAQPSLMLPLAVGAGFFYFFIIRRKR